MLNYCIRILLVFSLLPINLISQKKKIKDNFNYRATYQVTAKLDSLDQEFIVNEENYLFIGDRLSSFASKARLTGHIIKSYSNIASTPKSAITEFPFIIIKNMEEDVLYYLHKIGENNFMYSENLNQFDWKIEEEYRLIGKYNCQKATTKWAGRTFIAWFTLDLSLTNGPYKFSGLPGIIVDLEDSKGHYQYQMTAFKKLSEPLEFSMNMKDYIEISKGKLKKEFKSYSLNPNAYLNDPNVTMSPKVLNAYKKVFAERVKKRNNPIELDE